MKFEDLTEIVIGCAIEVHKTLGPGLFENVYESCLSHELILKNVKHECQKTLPVVYKGKEFDKGYKLDILVENNLILELKSVTEISDIHRSQLITYLKLSSIKVGLLISFNTNKLVEGISRVVV